MRSHSSLPTMRILALLLCLPALVAWSSGVLRPATTATATKAASMRMAVHGAFHVTKKPLLPQRFSPPRAAAASAVPEQESGGLLAPTPACQAADCPRAHCHAGPHTRFAPDVAPLITLVGWQAASSAACARSCLPPTS